MQSLFDDAHSHSKISSTEALFGWPFPSPDDCPLSVGNVMARDRFDEGFWAVFASSSSLLLSLGACGSPLSPPSLLRAFPRGGGLRGATARTGGVFDRSARVKTVWRSSRLSLRYSWID